MVDVGLYRVISRFVTILGTHKVMFLESWSFIERQLINVPRRPVHCTYRVKDSEYVSAMCGWVFLVTFYTKVIQYYEFCHICLYVSLKLVPVWQFHFPKRRGIENPMHGVLEIRMEHQ